MRIGLRMLRPMFRHHDLEQLSERARITNDRSQILLFTGEQPKPLRVNQHDVRTMFLFALRAMIVSFLLLSVIGDLFNPGVPSALDGHVASAYARFRSTTCPQRTILPYRDAHFTQRRTHLVRCNPHFI